MAREWILNKSHLSYWLRQIRREMTLVGPFRDNGDIVFRKVDNIHEISLDYGALVPSPKEFLFSQMELMLANTPKGVLDLRDHEERAIFGVRSCDISAVGLLDRFYLRDIPDPYYEARRKNTIFISIVCNTPDETCFCTGLGCGPYLSAGFDIQLYDLGDRYFVQSGSKKARKWVDRYTFLMRKPTKSDYEDQYEVELSSQAMFRKRISLKSARDLISFGRIGDGFWRGVTERCFECGGCVYECPVCTCFTVIDRNEDDRTERLRLWDTCFFKGFTRLAGGELPAEDRILRTKRWFYHKLLHWPDTFGAFGCVGCGRCTVTCPGRIDMATVVSRMKRDEKWPELIHTP